MDRLNLWLHLCSYHAGYFDPEMDLEEMIDEHLYEHEGPGTIRDHDVNNLDYDLGALKQILTEIEV